MAVIDVGLFDPPPHRRLGQIEVLRDLGYRAVALGALLDDVGLELPCERTTRPGFFLFATVSMMGILSGASPLIVDVRQTGSGPARLLSGSVAARATPYADE
jgi:hypothetical protein